QSADASGKVRSDESESKLTTTQAGAISTLKQQLPGLLPPHVLSGAERDRVLGKVTSIVGQILDTERARTFLAASPVFGQIHQQLEAFVGESYEMFPVSAIGCNRRPGEYPTHPFNIWQPFYWAARQADARRLEAAERAAAGLSRSGAIRVYEQLLEQGRFSR